MPVAAATRAFAVAAAVLVCAGAQASCSPRGDDAVAPFESADCVVTDAFVLRCTATISNADASWTDGAFLLADFGSTLEAPKRVELPAYNAEAASVEVVVEKPLEGVAISPLLALPPVVVLKLFGAGGKSAEQRVHTWVGMFRDALVPDESGKPPRNVLLLGLRGAGKSTLANSLVHVHYRYRPRRYMEWRPITEQSVASRLFLLLLMVSKEESDWETW